MIVSVGLIRKRPYTIFILMWALLLSYSRIYIGVHYPGDILGGMILGLLLGGIVLSIYKLIRKKLSENARTKKT
jgi:undecaprenyl-diphosphatase